MCVCVSNLKCALQRKKETKLCVCVFVCVPPIIHYAQLNNVFKNKTEYVFNAKFFCTSHLLKNRLLAMSRSM